jgi:hypothetical protein
VGSSSLFGSYGSNGDEVNSAAAAAADQHLTKLSLQVVGVPTAAVASAPKSSDEKLLDLTNDTQYNLVQRNGQRIYGGPPPGWMGPPPEKGCEIFVGKVPRDCYEDELVPIFSTVSLYPLMSVFT